MHTKYYFTTIALFVKKAAPSPRTRIDPPKLDVIKLELSVLNQFSSSQSTGSASRAMLGGLLARSYSSNRCPKIFDAHPLVFLWSITKLSGFGLELAMGAPVLLTRLSVTFSTTHLPSGVSVHQTGGGAFLLLWMSTGVSSGCGFKMSNGCDVMYRLGRGEDRKSQLQWAEVGMRLMDSGIRPQ